MRVEALPLQCDCTSCPLYQRRDCVPAELLTDDEHQQVKVLFVGEAPGKTEVEKQRPFIGESGRLLRRALDYASPVRLSYAFSNVLRCLPLDHEDEIRKPTPAEVKQCRGFLGRDIRVTDPDVIVLLGATAVELFVDGKPSVYEERGRWHRIDVEGRERLVITTWHPAYVLRQRNALPQFYKDLQFALRLAAGWRPPIQYSHLGENRCLRSLDEVAELADTLLSDKLEGKYVAFDVETRNLNKRYGNRLALLQFCWDGVNAYCVPLDHPETPFSGTELRAVRKLLRRVFTRKPRFRAWLTHFGKFEQTLVGQHILDRGDGIARTFDNAPMLDTGAFAYLLDENDTIVKGAYQLKHLARHYLDFQHYDDTTLMARAEGNLLRLPLDCDVPVGHADWEPNLTDYGAMDVQVTWRLFHVLLEQATFQRYRKKALRLLEHLFGPTFRLLSVIERNGFWGNLAHLKMLQDPALSPIVSRLNEIDRETVPDLATAQRANKKLVLQKSGGSLPLFGMPWVLDLNKNDHVRAWLIDEMGIEPLSHGKSGAPSVGKAFFQAYSDVEEVELVAERRGLAKLQSAYLKQLAEYLDPRYRSEDCQDGRVRCDLFFTTTVSGRGSAANPNMQQQVRGDSPAKAAVKNIWQAEQPGVQESFTVDFSKGPPDVQSRIVRKPTNCLVQLDFVTAEVKWWALLSRCPKLSEALLKGYRMRQEYRRDPRPELKEKAAIEGDLHKNTAALMYETPVVEVDKPMRTAAKSIVFGAMYGRGVRALAAQIKKSEDEASILLDKFAAAFPVGWEWLQECPRRAREDWFIESPVGRRRRLPGYLCWTSRMSHDDRKLVSECDRMAKNSPIQGISSDAAFLGASLFADYIAQNRLSWKVQNVVHDSCVYQVPIAELRESVEVAEQCFTTGTMGRMTDVWGVEFACPIEIDFEFGLAWGALEKWDFTAAEMARIVAGMTHQDGV